MDGTGVVKADKVGLLISKFGIPVLCAATAFRQSIHKFSASRKPLQIIKLFLEIRFTYVRYVSTV